MAIPVRLDNPPIIEAVLDIDCEFSSPLDLKEIEPNARKELAKNYPKLKHQFFQEHKFEAVPNEPPKLSVIDGLQSLQFVHKEDKQIVQFRTLGFTFNRLSPYSSLDNYLPQIKTGWTAFVRLSAPERIRQVRLRYINRILLPIGEGGVDFDAYLYNAPKSPDPNRLSLLGFINQYAALENVSNHQITSVLTLQPAERDKLPIIIDNTAINSESGDVDDWSWLRAQILELRELKNRVFWNTIKEECLSLF